MCTFPRGYSRSSPDMDAVLRVGAAVELLRVAIPPEDGRVEHEHGVGRTGEQQLSGVAALGPVQRACGVQNIFIAT